MSPSEQLVTNLMRIKTSQRLTWAEIAEALAAEGAPIPPLGLRRIVVGQRRVDVDEVVALATVLGVSPWWDLVARAVDVHLEIR